MAAEHVRRGEDALHSQSDSRSGDGGPAALSSGSSSLAENRPGLGPGSPTGQRFRPSVQAGNGPTPGRRELGRAGGSGRDGRRQQAVGGTGEVSVAPELSPRFPVSAELVTVRSAPTSGSIRGGHGAEGLQAVHGHAPWDVPGTVPGRRHRRWPVGCVASKADGRCSCAGSGSGLNWDRWAGVAGTESRSARPVLVSSPGDFWTLGKKHLFSVNRSCCHRANLHPAARGLGELRGRQVRREPARGRRLWPGSGRRRGGRPEPGPDRIASRGTPPWTVVGEKNRAKKRVPGRLKLKGS